MKRKMTRLVFLVLAWGCFASGNLLLAATITVNAGGGDGFTVADDGQCTLTEAIGSANTNAASGVMAGECVAGELDPVVDIIEFAPSALPGIINTVSELSIIGSLEIVGPGRQVLTLTNIAENRLFNIVSGGATASYTFRDLTLASNRVTTDGSAIRASLGSGNALNISRVHFFENSADRGGGAVALYGTSNTPQPEILIVNSVFEDNFVNDDESSDQETGGGAIFVGAGVALTVRNSTFDSNRAENLPRANALEDLSGGAILGRSADPLASSIVIDSSTFRSNVAYGPGGAIAIGGFGFPKDDTSLEIRHSTFTANIADFNDNQTGATINGGGGIWAGSSVAATLRNTVVALNEDRSVSFENDISGSIVSSGFNFISDALGHSGTFPAGQPNLNDDWVGLFPVILDPQLDVLADNGGPTPTAMPLAGSLLIDHGKCVTKAIDQRGFHDPVAMTRAVDDPSVTDSDDGCDIGAVERGSVISNSPPDANDDDYFLLEGDLVMFPDSTGVLSNDVDDDPLVVVNAGSFMVDNGSGLSGVVDLSVDGSFTFTPDDPDMNGDVTFGYEVTDQRTLVTAEATIHLAPVNDAPGFTASPLNLQLAPGAVFSEAGWASDISPGPANESGQAMQFVVSGSVPSNYFSAPPTVSTTTGDLEFTLHPQADGSVMLQIRLQDSGGTSNGGINFSSPVSLQIEAINADRLFSDSFE